MNGKSRILPYNRERLHLLKAAFMKCISESASGSLLGERNRSPAREHALSVFKGNMTLSYLIRVESRITSSLVIETEYFFIL